MSSGALNFLSVHSAATDIHVGLDIGGTLAKVVVVAPERLLKHVSTLFSNAVMIHEKFSSEEHDIRPEDLGFANSSGSERLAFEMFSFDSRDIGALLSFLKELLAPLGEHRFSVHVTGGGAVKFRSELQSAFATAVFVKVDEVEAIAKGFSFLVRRLNSAFIFASEDRSWTPVPPEEVLAPFPLLLVNIGSGVSMIKLEGPDQYERVQGSAIGGGTVLGLGKALFGAKSFEEIMDLSMQGNSGNVDISVGELIGAPPTDDLWNFNTLASSLTKLLTLDKSAVSRADLAQSIVRMVSYNIGYVAYLVSCLHDCPRIYFSGKYVNKHVPTMEAISYAVKFYENWKPPPAAEESLAKGLEEEPEISSLLDERKCDVRFLHHEGYVGAIGALLSSRNT